jgi:hypothetical protein
MLLDLITYLAFAFALFAIANTMPAKTGIVVLIGIGMAIRLVSRREKNGLHSEVGGPALDR